MVGTGKCRTFAGNLSCLLNRDRDLVPFNWTTLSTFSFEFIIITAQLILSLSNPRNYINAQVSELFDTRIRYHNKLTSG